MKIKYGALCLMLAAILVVSAVPLTSFGDTSGATTVTQAVPQALPPPPLPPVAAADFVIPVTHIINPPFGYTPIYTKIDLDSVRYLLFGNFILMNDIVFTPEDFAPGGDFYNDGAGWNPIGDYADNTLASTFSGIFDGNGYTISGLQMNQTTKPYPYAGLFGYVSEKGVVENLGLVNCNFVSATSSFLGGIAGFAGAGSAFSNCYVTGTIQNIRGWGIESSGGITGGANVATFYACMNGSTMNSASNSGGITGKGNARIDHCFNIGSITATIAIGGIIGKATNTSGGMGVGLCYNTGPVQSSNAVEGGSSAGGIVGDAVNSSDMVGIDNCYNTGSVMAAGNAGGIAGRIQGYINYSYNTGLVSGIGNTGGITASYDGTIYNCFYLNGVGGNMLRGTVVSDAAMQQQSTFAGFPFGEIWTMSTAIKRPVHEGFEPRSFELTYVANGGILPADTALAYMTGSSNRLPAATKTGYQLLGWVENADGSGVPMTVLPAGYATALTLYAKWIPNTYTIKFNDNGVTTGTMANVAMTYNVSKSLPANSFKKNGYVFLGWAKTSTGSVVYKDKASVKNLTSTNGETVNLYAKWGPPILSAASYNYTSIKVSWAYAGSATSYRIYRATSAAGSYYLVNIAASTARSWIDTGQTTGKTYYYKVSVVAGGKTYHHSTYKYAKAVPAAPTVTLSKASATSIKVSWTGVSGATKYQIFRAISATGTYTYLYTASSTARSWVNTGRTPGKTYYYKVRAYHLEGTTKVYGISSAVKYLKI